MRISHLAETTGVPVATVKYYLREGLLHQGVRTSATQARYDEGHVSRLRVVRALLGAGGLSVARARDVLASLEGGGGSVSAVLGIAQRSVTTSAPADVDLTRARALVDRWGWTIDPDAEDALASLEVALDALDAAGFPLPEGALDTYARSMAEVAEVEIAGIPTDSVDAAVRYVVLGTVLAEPLVLALRRLAQQHASWDRFGTLENGRQPIVHRTDPS